MATAAQRKGDFGTKVLKNPEEVVPKPEAGAKITLTIRKLKDGNEMTVDSNSVYDKEITLENVDAWASIGEVKKLVEEKEKLKDIRIFCDRHLLPDHIQIGQCYVNWMGYGMEHWPPKFIIKREPRGVEVVVDIPRMRDTAVWEGDTLKQYATLYPIFDVEPDKHTVRSLKEMITAKIRMPANRQELFTEVAFEDGSGTYFAKMEDDKLLKDYAMAQGSIIKFTKNQFDENGMYIFDDAYHDHEGYHPRPVDSHIEGPISTKWQETVKAR